MSRAAGILMPITSLPSPYGIGTIGKEAYKFADFLKKAGQTIWQILPVGPTSYGDSPYQSFSTYAGNPYMIDLDMLCEEGLLTAGDMDGYNYGTNPGYVDYEKIYNCRFEILRKAYENFKALDKDSAAQKAFRSFKRKNAGWLKNYALYMSVKKSFGMKSWTEWDDESIRLRDEKAVARYTRKFSDDIGFWSFVQFKFYEQWEKFRAYVNSLGIKILGDMPIYVAMDSADTWANPEVFWLDESRNPVCVAGCPPDYFSATGQLWGNPLYNWDYLKETGYKWWFERIKAATALFDITRIDHFRAFDTYYAIPFPAENAIGGSWKEGPGIEFFNLMNEQIDNVEIVAEDLGDLTPGVKQLLLDCGYPGMKILEFAFGGDNDNEYLPHLYPENCVVYTGTHDNDTIMGWRAEADENTIRHAYEYCHLSDEEGFNWGIIRTAYESRAKYAIIPMQDLLGLGSEARINTPSTLGGNWEWRIDAASLTDELAAKLNSMVNTYNR
ncbi:MAG: 4-alpha-glucanotransferase [Ruminococcus sp.]|nr:4-alpha-glucanotransferase [Ruminococcus sp.]